MVAVLAVAMAGSWTLVLGGDVMLNGIRAGTGPLDGIAEIVRGADIAVANLEIPLTRATSATKRKTAAELKARTQFILKADPAHAPHLAATGWDLVSLGNNHSMDYGPEGLEEMLRSLAANKIGWAGAGANRVEAKRPGVFEAAGGVRVGLVSMLAYRTQGALWKCQPATERSPGLFDLGIGGLDEAALRTRLRGLVAMVRARSDVVLVALHGGVERQTVPNAHQVRLARAFVDSGADVVLGHHPHVLQGAELYKGKPILYSTGNLISPLPGDTALFRLSFADRRLVGFEALPCRIAGGKVKPTAAARTEAAEKRFDALCRKVAERYPHPEAKALGAHWAAVRSPAPSANPPAGDPP